MAQIIKQKSDVNNYMLQLLSAEGISVFYRSDTVHLSSAVMSEEQITDVYNSLDDVALAKSTRIRRLKDETGVNIKGGFLSNALGEDYLYPSREWEDQINIMGAAFAQIDLPFTCTKVSDSVKQQYLHTAAQMMQVYIAGIIFKQVSLGALQAKIDEINASNDITFIEGVSL